MEHKSDKTFHKEIRDNDVHYQDGVFENIRRSRRYWLIFFMLLWMSVLVWRLYYLQIYGAYDLKDRGIGQHIKKIMTSSERGNIYDRDGNIMASSIEAPSVFVHPQKIKNKEEVANVLSKILSMNKEEILEKFNTKAPFVWIKRKTSRDIADKILKLADPAIQTEKEFKRIYPYSSAASTLIGKVGVDNIGLSGLEAVFDKKLRGTMKKEIIEKDALGKSIKMATTKLFEVPRGEDINLTIDADIQLIVDEEVEYAREDLKAKAIIATMIDAYTGDILAMSQSPGVNFNEDSSVSQKELKNLVIETVFEPGSIFKPIVASIAYELGLVHESDMFDCEMGKYYYGGRIIKDSHPAGVLSLRDVVIKSSNIGMTKIADRLGKEKLYKALVSYGVGRVVSLDFPGETAGILRNYKNWAKVDVATHSFGQGVAVTSLQILRALASYVNDGYLVELRLLQSNPIKKERIISEKTANFMKNVLIDVVALPYGTGKRAKIDEYIVGGKTGTAQKAKDNGRGYEEGKYIASFVGFVDTLPLNIKIMPLLIVSVDEAHSDSIYGGALAGPVFQKIMKRTMKHLERKSLLK